MEYHLFSYGTLQLKQVQLETFGRLLKGTTDTLVGYRIEKIKITDPDVLAVSQEPYHPIATHTGHIHDHIEGSCFSITKKELEHADTYEVSDYKRVKIILRSGKEAWVYIKI